MTHARVPLPATLTRTGVVAVLRAPHWAGYEPVVTTLVESGVLAVELTLTTPEALRAVPGLRATLAGSGALVGLGTVTTVTEAQAAVAAGVDFIVTPTADPSVVEAAVSAGVPVLPGALSPTEVLRVWSAGASAVKLFPAATVGPSYLSHLHGPFPDVPLVPSGGYGLKEIPSWIGAGAVAVSLGSALVGDAFDGRLEGLADRAARALAAVTQAREDLATVASART